MEKIKNLFKNLRYLYSKHKILLVITCISILFAIWFDYLIYKEFMSAYCKFNHFILFSPFAFIPTICLILNFIASKLAEKDIKFFSILINLILFLVLNFIFYIILYIISLYAVNYLPRNPKKYHAAIELINVKDREIIKSFFPENIPANAKNIKFDIVGEGLIDYTFWTTLSFKISPENIKEIKNKYKSIKSKQDIKGEKIKLLDLYGCVDEAHYKKTNAEIIIDEETNYIEYKYVNYISDNVGDCKYWIENDKNKDKNINYLNP